MKAVVVALGKIGLPIAAQLTNTGHTVVGCDIDARVVETVNAGKAPFPNEAGLDEALARAVAVGRLRATTDTAAAVAEGPDLVIAVPPLIVDDHGTPEWSAVDAVVADIGRGLAAAQRRGITVAIETTLPTGTTRNRIAPALERASGLKAETDFHLVFSPERVYSGRILADLATYPKLVGGLSAAGEAHGTALYAQFLPEVEVWPMGGAEAAELTKLAETTYRDINIAFANELARHSDALGVDVQRVIDAANSQPFSHIHRPGVAVGGHCIPVYPRFYLAGDPTAQLPAAARTVNEAMPAYAVAVLQELLGGIEGARVLILGVAYRGGVKETAFSGAMPLRDNLRARGAIAVADDPLYDHDELRSLGFEPWDGMPVHGVIVQADHAEYAQLRPADLAGARGVVDGRGVLDAAAFAAAGVPVRRLGDGAGRPN
ncbi:MAG: nucleotide sugar dehydrogenase [Solirubrobacteraceae bacterium]|nr:nucleotide sugar dehydrogenase [Solirubrobacteraceae bacterium]